VAAAAAARRARQVGILRGEGREGGGRLIDCREASRAKYCESSAGSGGGGGGGGSGEGEVVGRGLAVVVAVAAIYRLVYSYGSLYSANTY